MLKLLPVLMLAVLAGGPFDEIPDALWVHVVSPGVLCGTVISVDTDAEGYSYVTGQFSDTTDFGGTVLVPQGTGDMFLAKYDTGGNLIWVRQAGGAVAQSSRCDQGEGVAVDQFGNCYVAGSFWGTAYFDGDSLVSAGESDMFLAKYDADGNVEWMRGGGGLYADAARGVAIDPNGDAFLVGDFRSAASIGDTTLTSPGQYSPDIVVAKYTSAGSFLWARQATSPNHTAEAAVAADFTGNCFVTGRYNTQIDFDGLVLAESGINVFIAKYDGAGGIQWARSSSSSGGGDAGYAIAADSTGDCYATGSYLNTVTFGDTTLPSVSGEYEEMFVVKYSGSGSFLWARGVTGVVAGFDQVNGEGIVIDAGGDCLVTGSFIGNAVFDDTTLTQALFFTSDAIVAKYSADGTFAWALQAGPGARGLAIAPLAGEDFVFAGAVNDTANFSDIVVDPEAYSYFVAKYGPTVPVAAGDIVPAAQAALHQNYPNPFNPSTTIRYTIAGAGHVTLRVYDVTGRLVRELVNEKQRPSAMWQSVTWDGKNESGESVSSGVYFCCLKAGGKTLMKKMVLVK